MQVACKAACSHIAKSILNILVSEDLKQISMGALHQVNLDTIQCERKFCIRIIQLYLKNHFKSSRNYEVHFELFQ